MRSFRSVLPAALMLTLAATAPACSSESGERATTDAPAGSNETGTRTTESDDVKASNDAGAPENGGMGDTTSDTHDH